MKFSIYSEIQYWGGKSQKRAYDEVIEQVVHADRLGYDAYAVIEHFFFPKFSISANPFALLGEARRDEEHQVPHARARPAVPQPHGAGLADRGGRILFDGRYEFGALRGHGGCRPRPVCRSGRRRRYEESLEILFKALRNERFAYDGTYYDRRRAHRPPPETDFRVFLGGTSDPTYELAASAAGRSACLRCCRTSR